MTTNAMLSLTRIEALARAVEEVEVDDDVPAAAQAAAARENLEVFLSRSELSIGEIAILLGEILSSRKMAGMGSGVIATMRGSTDVVQEKGFYKRLKFKFFLEIGSPVGNVDPKELDELGMRTWHQWGKKLFGEIKRLQAEMGERKKRESN